MLKRIWASFGKDVAQWALANVAVSLKWPAYDATNVAQLSNTVSGPVLAKNWHGKHWLMWFVSLKWPAYDAINVSQLP